MRIGAKLFFVPSTEGAAPKPAAPVSSFSALLNKPAVGEPGDIRSPLLSSDQAGGRGSARGPVSPGDQTLAGGPTRHADEQHDGLFSFDELGVLGLTRQAQSVDAEQARSASEDGPATSPCSAGPDLTSELLQRQEVQPVEASALQAARLAHDAPASRAAPALHDAGTEGRGSRLESPDAGLETDPVGAPGDEAIVPFAPSVILSQPAIPSSEQPPLVAGAASWPSGITGAAPAIPTPPKVAAFMLNGAGLASSRAALDGGGATQVESEFADRGTGPPEQQPTSNPGRGAPSANSEVSVLVTGHDALIQVVAASPDLDQEGRVKLRKLADDLTSEFGVRLSEMTINGRSVEVTPLSFRSAK